MAVPVKGAQILLEAILKTLEGVDYDFAPPSHNINELLEGFVR